MSTYEFTSLENLTKELDELGKRLKESYDESMEDLQAKKTAFANNHDNRMAELANAMESLQGTLGSFDDSNENGKKLDEINNMLDSLL
jgi:predicted transcriptional regulator